MLLLLLLAPNKDSRKLGTVDLGPHDMISAVVPLDSFTVFVTGTGRDEAVKPSFCTMEDLIWAFVWGNGTSKEAANVTNASVREAAKRRWVKRVVAIIKGRRGRRGEGRRKEREEKRGAAKTPLEPKYILFKSHRIQ